MSVRRGANRRMGWRRGITSRLPSEPVLSSPSGRGSRSRGDFVAFVAASCVGLIGEGNSLISALTRRSCWLIDGTLPSCATASQWLGANGRPRSKETGQTSSAEKQYREWLRDSRDIGTKDCVREGLIYRPRRVRRRCISRRHSSMNEPTDPGSGTLGDLCRAIRAPSSRGDGRT